MVCRHHQCSAHLRSDFGPKGLQFHHKQGDGNAVAACCIFRKKLQHAENGSHANHLIAVSLCKVFCYKFHMSKKSECFVFVATDDRFMAMVKHSAKTRLFSGTGGGVFTVMTHSIRKTSCSFDI
jgi:hypothetical protein